ncbi:MAG: hypothetical protein KDA41_15215 [Planctomycetales bacterium]|nr:hypothetical protein [Planctomycetales bacterium]
MGTFTANWEDEENNRIVELWVEYERHPETPRISSVTPAAVTFVDSITKAPLRKIRVWTAAGRRLLLSQYNACCGGDHLERELAGSLLVAAQ